MDPYKILGVDKDASQADIRRAYRLMAKKHHPDAGGDVWAFQQVNDAYEQLTSSPSDEYSTAASNTPQDAGQQFSDLEVLCILPRHGVCRRHERRAFDLECLLARDSRC